MIKKIVRLCIPQGVLHKCLILVTWLKWHNKMMLGKDVELYNIDIQGVMGGVKIGDNSVLHNCRFVFNGAPNNNVYIGKGTRLIGAEFILRNGGNNTIIIGNNTTTGGSCQFAACEESCITIGDDCQFAHQIAVWTTDHHPIYDMETGLRTNHAKNIVIHNHVWVGTGTLILKGTEIADNSIIGAHSVVSGKHETPNCVYAGVPAKIVKKGIEWRRYFDKGKKF